MRNASDFTGLTQSGSDAQQKTATFQTTFPCHPCLRSQKATLASSLLRDRKGFVAHSLVSVVRCEEKMKNYLSLRIDEAACRPLPTWKFVVCRIVRRHQFDISGVILGRQSTPFNAFACRLSRNCCWRVYYFSLFLSDHMAVSFVVIRPRCGRINEIHFGYCFT